MEGKKGYKKVDAVEFILTRKAWKPGFFSDTELICSGTRGGY